MKRVLLLALALLLALPSMAHADVLWEPYEDSFYMAHREECTPQQPSRAYVARGESAPLYPAPDQPAKGEIPAGQEVYISWLYTAPDGGEWGYASGPEELGWVNLYDLLLVYDSIAFMEDYGPEIKQETVSISAMCPEGFIFWSYPLSGRIAQQWSTEWDYEGMTAEQTYTDPEGRLWGYVGYWRGRHNAWICLSDPLNQSLGIQATPPEAEEPAEPSDVPAQTEEGLPLLDTGAPEYRPATGLGLPWLGLGLGAGAALLAAALIKLTGRKGKR